MELIVQSILNSIGYSGYTGVFVLMFLESSFFPFPSEVVVPPAAYLASKGEMNLYLVIIYSILGSLFGSLFNYYISYKMGYKFLEKYGKYVGLSPKTLKKVCMFFEKHGAISTFAGRLIPGVRQYISLPAGLSKMNIVAFILFTTVGVAIWVGILAFIGFSVGNHPEMVKTMLHKSYTYIIICLSIILITYIYWRKKYDR